jgi:hypothetical protein
LWHENQIISSKEVWKLGSNKINCAKEMEAIYVVTLEEAE